MSQDSGDDLKALERALGALSPRPLRLSRDRVLFEAGQTRMRRHTRWWQASTLVLGALVAFLGWRFLASTSGTTQVLVPIVVVEPVPADPHPDAAASAATSEPEYGRLLPETSHTLDRNAYGRVMPQVLRFGVDAWPTGVGIGSGFKATPEGITSAGDIRTDASLGKLFRR